MWVVILRRRPGQEDLRDCLGGSVVTSENIMIPGRSQCILCRGWKLPSEMHYRTCQDCYEAIKARNKNKPKPKGKKNNNPTNKIPSSAGLGWRERDEKPILTISEDYYKPTTRDGFRVPDTDNGSNDLDKEKTTSSNSIRVPDTVNDPIDNDCEKSEAKGSIRVSETGKEPQTINFNKTRSLDGIRVSELERYLDRTNELLAEALRRIKALEKKMGMLSPIIEKEEAKKNVAGMQKLRDDLFKLLNDRKKDGIYVHQLYGPNGKKGGPLGTSKAQAFRLRDACRLDSRFRVERSDNSRGNWAIRLNIYIK